MNLRKMKKPLDARRRHNLNLSLGSIAMALILTLIVLITQKGI